MVLMAFLLMLGIHARNILWGMTKCPKVDDTSELRIKVTARSNRCIFILKLLCGFFKLL